MGARLLCWNDWPTPKRPAPAHPQLGRLVGQLLRVVFDYDSDPISRATGYYGDPRPTMERLCADAGTTLAAVVADVDARVDAKTAHQLGLAHLADEAGL